MKKALVIVQSRESITQQYGKEIADFLLDRGLATELVPINNFQPNYLNGTDYLLVSGWGDNSIFSNKRPDSEWEAFVGSLPTLSGIKTALFTSSKFFAGRMFKSMKKYLSKKTDDLQFEFKSRDGSLSISDKMALNDFIR